MKILVACLSTVLLANLAFTIKQQQVLSAGQTKQEADLLKLVGGRHKLAGRCLQLEEELKETKEELKEAKEAIKDFEPLLYVFTDGSHWSCISDRPMPKGKTIRRTLQFIEWDVCAEVCFHPNGRNAQSIVIALGGCGNEESTLFLQKISELTVRRHPDDYHLTISRDKCLTRWVKDEANIAVGVEDGRGVDPREILRRVGIHLNKVFEENKLGVSARGQGWTDPPVGRIFIN